MKNKRILSLGILSSLVATLLGCGVGGTQVGIQTTPEQLPTIKTKGGEEFALGFDEARYQKISKKSKITKLPKQSLLPVKADNRQFSSPIANQGKLGACTAFAAKGFREYMQRKDGERQVPLSALFFYYEARWDKSRDSGSTNSDSVTTMATTGFASEAIWPYDITKFMIAPPAAAYDEAKEFKFNKAIRISGLEDAKVAMSKGMPVLFAYDVYESFRAIGSDGMMPMPKTTEKRIGGHAVVAVGYDSQTKLVTVRNSWGDRWGASGYFYMPYDVFERYSRDLWTTDFRTTP